MRHQADELLPLERLRNLMRPALHQMTMRPRPRERKGQRRRPSRLHCLESQQNMEAVPRAVYCSSSSVKGERRPCTSGTCGLAARAEQVSIASSLPRCAPQRYHHGPSKYGPAKPSARRILRPRADRALKVDLAQANPAPNSWTGWPSRTLLARTSFEC